MGRNASAVEDGRVDETNTTREAYSVSRISMLLEWGCCYGELVRLFLARLGSSSLLHDLQASLDVKLWTV